MILAGGSSWRSPLVLGSRAANFPNETPPRDGNCYKTDKDRVLARYDRHNWDCGLVATIAHGAGLMLVPIYLGLCRAADLDKGHEAAGALINANLGMAVLAPSSTCRDDDSRRILGVASLLLPWVLSSRRGAGSIWMQLGPSVSCWWCSIAWDQLVSRH
jgi:hypothetical protein